MDFSRRKQILIIAGLVVFLIGFIIAVMYIKSDKGVDYSNKTGQKTIIIDNQTKYNNGLKPSVFASIGTSTYAVLTQNVKEPKIYYHGSIRDSTFKKNSNIITFVLDIPDAKVSWKLTQNINKEGEGVSDALIECVDKDLLIYPEIAS